MSAYDDIMGMPAEERAKLLSELDQMSDMEMDQAYREMLDETYGTVKIAGLEYSTSDALKAVDPVAYRCGFSDWEDSLDEITEIAGGYYQTSDFEAAYEAWETENKGKGVEE